MPEQLYLRSLLGALAALMLFSPAIAPAQEKDKAAPPAQQPTTVLHTSTQLVVVDVTVTDGNGKPIHGLTRDNFQIVEGKTPQATRNFEEHSNTAPSAPAVKLPPMPPGTFTDYVAVKPNSTLNVILLDTINTPMSDQSYVRDQLKKYVKQAPADAQIAIIGMGSKLTILQGFTSDPEILKNAVEHKLAARGSNFLEDSVGSNLDQPKLSEIAADSGDPEAVANLEQWEAEMASNQLQLRIQYTLDSFEALARYLSGFDGRKNLIWFSGSFPLNIMPDDSITNPFAVVANAEDEYREVSNLLTRAQIAVYPVDARGLMVQPMFDASRSGKSYARKPNQIAIETTKFSESQAAEHTTMQLMADDTGGHAFYNTNGLAGAVSQAIDSGSNYYTLTYSPSNHDWNSAYRAIHVNLEGSTPHNLKLNYRHGYYADDPSKGSWHHNNSATVAESTTANTIAAKYARTVMSRGAPAPSDILFKVRVLPAATTTEDAVAPGNLVDPKLHGPYRRYMVDFAALASTFSWKLDTNGRRLGEATFEILVFNADGGLLNAASKTLRFNLTPEIYSTLQKQGMNLHLEVSAPAKGESFLRVAIQDVPSNRFGVVEVPTSSVARLQPPPAPPTVTQPPATAAPGTPPGH